MSSVKVIATLGLEVKKKLSANCSTNTSVVMVPASRSGRSVKAVVVVPTVARKRYSPLVVDGVREQSVPACTNNSLGVGGGGVATAAAVGFF